VEAFDVAEACWRRFGGAAADDPRAPRLRLYLDVRGAELSGGRVVGGPALRLSEWLPDDDASGVRGSARAMEGLGLDPPPAAGGP